MKKVTIYCDGACSGNPGPGGWGGILMYQSFKKELSGYHPQTTNNRMELQACIECLAILKEPCEVDVYTDSAYLYNAFTKNWLGSWQSRGWKKADKKPVENVEYWKRLLELTAFHKVKFHKVKGHTTTGPMLWPQAPLQTPKKNKQKEGEGLLLPFLHIYIYAQNSCFTKRY